MPFVDLVLWCDAHVLRCAVLRNVRTRAAGHTHDRREMASRRTTHRSGAGKKLYAVRDEQGQFEDIQTFERAHAQDLRQQSAAEAAETGPRRKKAARKAKKKAKTAPRTAAKKGARKKASAKKGARKAKKKAARKA